MKNLFKNLMLVAVAAMAFTACSQDVNEVNKVEKVARYEFTANFADTRSGFAEKEEGATAYKSEWFGNETLKVCANGEFTSAQTIKVDDAEGHFTVEFNGDNVPSMIDVYSPASVWNDENYPTIPAVQTPGAHSVDPAAHILKAQAASVESGVVTLQHMVAYGKMTVNTPADFEISKVELSLVGLPNSYWTDNQTYSYTINANEVEGNVFWFATEAMQIVKEFTVTAYNEAGNSVSKTVSGLTEGQLGFTAGRVSTFSVSGLEAVDNTPKFDIAEDDTKGGQDRYVWFMTEDNSLNDLKVNFYNCFDENEKTLNIGSYKTPANYGIYDNYSTYGGVKIGYMEATVTCKSGLYHIVFENIKDMNGNMLLEKAVFHGSIINLNNPDLRTKLALPSNVTISVSGKTITLNWDAVVGADGYKVKMWYPYDEAKEEIVYDTQYVFEAQKGNTKYCFNVYSYANDDNAEYKSTSDWVAKEITTEDTDPKMEVNPESLKFKADGETKEIVVTLKNFTADITVSHGDNEWLTLTPNGNVISVSVAANDVAEKRFDTIVVTAGEFTKEISVEQAAKKTEVAGEQDGSENNPFIYTNCEVDAPFGYYRYTFTGDDLPQLQIESNWDSGYSSFPYIGENCGFGNTEKEYYYGGTTYGGGYLDSDNTKISTADLGDGKYQFKFKLVLQSGETVWYIYEGPLTL